LIREAVVANAESPSALPLVPAGVCFNEAAPIQTKKAALSEWDLKLTDIANGAKQWRSA